MAQPVEMQHANSKISVFVPESQVENMQYNGWYRVDASDDSTDTQQQQAEEN